MPSIVEIALGVFGSNNKEVRTSKILVGLMGYSKGSPPRWDSGPSDCHQSTILNNSSALTEQAIESEDVSNSDGHDHARAENLAHARA